MPVLRYRNRLSPQEIIQKIIDSMRRMNARMDFMIAIWNSLFPGFSITPTEPKRKNLMENKEIIPIKIESLEEIKKGYEFEEATTLATFTEIENPVVDGKGFVRDRNSPHIGRNLYTQDPVTITESTDLKKIQRDNKRLESMFERMMNKMDDMSNKMDEQAKKHDQQISELNKKLGEQNKKLDEQSKIIGEQNKKLDEQAKEIAGLRKDNAEQAKEIAGLRKDNAEQAKEIAGLRKDNAEQAKEIAALRKDNAELHKDNVGLLEKMDSMNNKLEEQNKIIVSQAEKIVDLNVKMEQKDKDWKLKLADQTEKFDIKMNAVLAQMDEKDKGICALKTQVYEQSKEIIELKEINKEKDKIIDKLSDNNRILNEKVVRLEALTASLNADSDQFVQNNNHHPKKKLKEPKISRSEESVGRSWQPLFGFAHTLTFFDGQKCSPFYHEKTENAFRRLAYEGNVDKLKKRLDENKNKMDINDGRLRNGHLWSDRKMNINGRGMPDAICSIARGFKDKTALMLASQKGHVDCVKLLIEHEAEINYLDRESFTALDYAQQNKHKEVVDFLKENGALNGVDVLHYLNKEGIQKKGVVQYEEDNFTVVDHTPAAVRAVR